MADFRTGNGTDWLDFLGTLLGRYRDEQVEMLAGPDDLRAWLAEHGWEPAVAPAEGDVVAARRLREALHRLAVSAVQGRPPAASDVGTLNEALPDAAALRVAPHDGSLRMGPPPDAGAALARLAGQ